MRRGHSSPAFWPRSLTKEAPNNGDAADTTTCPQICFREFAARSTAQLIADVRAHATIGRIRMLETLCGTAVCHNIGTVALLLVWRENRCVKSR